MLDQLVGNRSPIGVTRSAAVNHSELVDHSDEWSGSDGWPDGQDAESDDPPLRFRHEDRCGGDEEEVAKVSGLAPGSDGIERENARRSVEIGESGGADVNLHHGSLSGVAATCMLHRATSSRIPRNALHLRMGRRYDAATLEPPGDATARPSATWRKTQVMQKTMRWTAILAMLLLVLAACQPAGDGGAATDGGASGEPSAAAEPPTDELGVVEIPDGEPLHIGFWGVISGADASLGTDSQRGVEIAIDDLGGELLGHEIQLTSQDGLCTPEGGATAAQALAADTTIVGLIGSTCSDETVGGIQAITEAGLTTISPSNTRPALTAEDRDETYAGYLRTAHNDEVQGRVVAEFAYNELGLTTAATIHDGSAYAEALQQVFADEFAALGGTITSQEAVDRGQTDMSTVLSNVAADSPEFLYYPIFTAEGGYITSQVRDVGGLEDTVLAGSDGLFSGDFVEASGPNVEGMYLSSPDFSAFTDAYADFLSAYEEKYGEAPIQIFHAHAHDAANMLFQAIEDVAVEVDGTLYVPKGALRDRIYATADFPGLTGTLTCNEFGDCSAPIIAMYQVTAREVGGEWPPEAPFWSPEQ